MPSPPRFVHHPDYHIELPVAHRFPMKKFRLLYELLLREGLATPEDFVAPELMPTIAQLELVHDSLYVDRILNGGLDAEAERRIGLPWSPALAQRTRVAVAGTLCTARLALEYGLACNTAGGTHHAFPDYGSGFCLFNDLAVTARVLRAENPGLRILIVDLDVHQGDGTAFIFRDEAEVFTFSMHCENNFPGTKQSGDRDVALPAGTGDGRYLDILREELPGILRDFAPALILYDAGVDTHAEDPLGRLEMSDAGLAARDNFVLRLAREANIPIACVIGGGYGADLEGLAARHAILHRQARNFFD
ncbi:MAG: histone deacetylase [Leptospirales bacterium]|jgi:acetoin utilization deacetylase AcuC-like enzyme